MIRLFLLFLLLAAISAATADDQIDRIYDRLSRGDLSGAEQDLGRLPAAPARDGNRLFIQALLEKNGVKARELLEAALNANLDDTYAEEAQLRLLQLAEAGRDTAAVMAAAQTYMKKFRNGRLREDVLAALAAHTADGAQRIAYLDQLIKEFPNDYFGQYARLAKADDAFHKDKFKEAGNICRQITGSGDEDLAPAALVMLADIALKKSDAEGALLNYNIIREQYPAAVGQERLETALKSYADTDTPTPPVVEKKSGAVVYMIQLGVFASKDNAGKMADRAKAYGYKTEIRKKNIAGKSLFAVMAGRFATQKEAHAAKEKLERGEGQVFKIVVDDEK